MTPAAYRAWGIAFAVCGVLAFSVRPILIKLSYAAAPVSPVTLLFLRMVLSLPFFLAVAWWLRNEARRAFTVFNRHVRECPDCDPTGQLCFIGDGLNDEVSTRAALALRAELGPRESER